MPLPAGYLCPSKERDGSASESHEEKRRVGEQGNDTVAAADLLAADAEVVTPEGVSAGAEFLAAMRVWPGLDNLDISVRDRVITEEAAVFVARATRVFSWKESGEIAYEQAAEARATIDAGQVIKLELL